MLVLYTTNDFTKKRQKTPKNIIVKNVTLRCTN